MFHAKRKWSFNSQRKFPYNGVNVFFPILFHSVRVRQTKVSQAQTAGNCDVIKIPFFNFKRFSLMKEHPAIGRGKVSSMSVIIFSHLIGFLVRWYLSSVSHPPHQSRIVYCHYQYHKALYVAGKLHNISSRPTSHRHPQPHPYYTERITAVQSIQSTSSFKSHTDIIWPILRFQEPTLYQKAG